MGLDLNEAVHIKNKLALAIAIGNIFFSSSVIPPNRQARIH